MQIILIKIGIVILNIIYFFIKLIPTKMNKITFISRQSNKLPLDFELLIEELKKEQPNCNVVALCKMLEDGINNKIKYCFHMLKQMYHIATSKVVVLDSYCIPICLLKHKKGLTIIQIWHALGSLKKFGYSCLDQKDGRNSKIAKAMKMHKNYTYILTSSEKSKPFFMEAFDAKEEQMMVMSIPRVDFLQSEDRKREILKRFYEIYPEINNKKENILYCPTQRKTTKIPIDIIAESVNLNKYNFIVKMHDGTEIIYVEENKKLQRGKEFTGLELLHIGDYIITDYSAIVYEAAITKKPIYLYTFDYDTYVDDRGFYINYKEEMPGPICKTMQEIMNKIENNEFDSKKEIEFCNKYIDNTKPNATKKLVEFINENMNKKIRTENN